jgi:hypothetical protein
MQKVCTEGHTIFLHVHVIIKTRIFNHFLVIGKGVNYECFF